MNRIWLIILIAALLLLWAVRTAGQEGARVQGDPSSLKLYDNLIYATDMARAWERDALLIGIDAAEVKEDGTVDIADPTRPGAFIAYRYFSPAALTRTGDVGLAHKQILLEKNQILLTDDRERSMSPLPEGFKDLDKVWEAARRKGASGRAAVSLRYRDGAVRHPFCFAFVAGPRSMRIDALTCEVVEEGVK